MRMVLAAAAVALMSVPALAGEDVTYKVGGKDFEGYFAKASGNSAGLVVIVHDWDGLDGYEKKRADTLASLGYDAFAVDMYGKSGRPTNVDGYKAATGKLFKDRATMRALIEGGVAAARSKSSAGTVVMGYCFGGTVVLELARSGAAKDIKGYATFHGGLATPPGQSFPKGTPPMLIAHGGADRIVKMADVAALSSLLEQAGVKYEIQVYSGARHAFSVPGGRYQEAADKKSWDAFTDFLKANL